MGRKKSNGDLCKPAILHSLEQKKEILDQYILMRKVNDLTQAQITEKLGITPQILYKWIKEKDLKIYEKRFKEATKIGDYNSSEELIIDAKKSLRDLIRGVKKIERTLQYKYDAEGNKTLVTEYYKETDIPADFEQIKFVLEKLTNTYSDNSAKNILQTFMSFNTYLQEISPELAQRISILQNNYLSNISEISEIK